jgi:hypothetical protein
MSAEYHYSNYRGYGLRFHKNGWVTVLERGESLNGEAVALESCKTLEEAIDYITNYIADRMRMDLVLDTVKADASEYARETLDEVNARRGYTKED